MEFSMTSLLLRVIDRILEKSGTLGLVSVLSLIIAILSLSIVLKVA